MNYILYTPLEQFDQVVWLNHNTLEVVDSWFSYLIDSEFVIMDSNIMASVTSSMSYDMFPLSSGSNLLSLVGMYGFELSQMLKLVLYIMIILMVYLLLVFYDNMYMMYMLPLMYLFTGTMISMWFTDVFFNELVSLPLEHFVNQNNYQNISLTMLPQMVYGVSVDEMVITLMMGFFFMGGSVEDEEDFMMSETGDSDIAEEVVAPLFVANLGSSIEENAGLYLKVCTLFSFILVSNLLGSIPNGDTATSSLMLTFWVSFSVFSSLVALSMTKHGLTYFFGLFSPKGCPFPLIFLLVPMEFLSYSFRLVSLAVRLFANSSAGHTLSKVLIGFSYMMFTLGEGFAVAAFLPALVVFVLIFLEMAVACIQSYMFTILSVMYLKDVYTSH